MRKNRTKFVINISLFACMFILCTCVRADFYKWQGAQPNVKVTVENTDGVFKNNEITLLSHSGKVLIEVTNDIVSFLRFTPDASSWVKVREKPDNYYLLEIMENLDPSPRMTVITLANADSPSSKISYTMTQAGTLTPVIVVDIDPLSGGVSGDYLALVSQAGEATFTVLNDLPTTCIIENEPDWLQITQTEEDKKVYHLVFSENPEITTRTAKIVFSNTNMPEMKRVFVITQAMTEAPKLKVEPDVSAGSVIGAELSLYQRGGHVLFTVTNRIDTEVSLPDGVNWIQIVELEKGIFNIIAPLNTSEDPRQTQITFTNRINPELKTIYNISQQGAETPLVEASTELTVGEVNGKNIRVFEKGGDILFKILNHIDVETTMVGTSDWVTISAGIEPDTYILTVKENLIKAPRSITLTFSNKHNPSLATAFEIKQDALNQSAISMVVQPIKQINGYWDGTSVRLQHTVSQVTWKLAVEGLNLEYTNDNPDMGSITQIDSNTYTFTSTINTTLQRRKCLVTFTDKKNSDNKAAFLLVQTANNCILNRVGIELAVGHLAYTVAKGLHIAYPGEYANSDPANLLFKYGGNIGIANGAEKDVFDLSNVAYNPEGVIINRWEDIPYTPQGAVTQTRAGLGDPCKGLGADWHLLSSADAYDSFGDHPYTADLTPGTEGWWVGGNHQTDHQGSLFFPHTGLRFEAVNYDSTQMYNVGIAGFCWFSSSECSAITSRPGYTRLTTLRRHPDTGNSVRCVREWNP